MATSPPHEHLPRKTIIAVVGPTGTGKTALGLAIAAQLRTEVISVDSLQCYKHGHTMTAAPTAAETEQVKHHMTGYLPPDAEPGDEFVLRAVAAVDGLHAKGKIPVLVGGSTSLMLPLLFSPRGHSLKGSRDWGKSLGRLRWRTLVIILNVKNEESLGKRLDARVEEMLARGLLKDLQDLYSLQKELLGQNGRKRIEEEEVGRKGVWKCIGYKELYPFLVATDNTLRTSSPRIKSHGNGNGNASRLVEEGEQRERLFREGLQQMKENTRRYAQLQATWAEGVLVPELRTAGVPVHRLEIPLCSSEEAEERDGEFKNRWVQSVERPAVRLCEAWREAAHLRDDAVRADAVAVMGGVIKENNGKRNNNRTEIGMLSSLVMVRSSTAR